ncbi:polysaccharide pyruvyl transferase family protein [Paraglaciecola sp.]|uniref:polysaccharide pyruvyl transferase family protein n=3 Tax=Paraglaciecola sp. TaxID=1920173 RepID=UPI0032656B5D
MFLKNIIKQTLLPSVPENILNIVLVDPPDYPNIGDSAIFLGQMNFLNIHFPQAKVHFIDHRSYAKGQKYLLEQADCIFFQGGGNFGDLWKRHQKIRLAIMNEFSHKRLIQFPQSIHFETQDSIKETADAIAKCAHYSLFVRDKKSLEFARHNFSCTTELIPDMAFYLPTIVRLPAKSDVFCLLREDKELLVNKTEAINQLLKAKALTYSYSDWVVEKAPLQSKLNLWLCYLIKRYPSQTKLIQPFYEKLRLHYAHTNLTRGIALLSEGERVVTDRLHAFIMSTLLGIKNYTFDSLGGKISNFHHTWMTESDLTYLLNEVDDLQDHL